MHDNTGLKGVAAAFAKQHLEDEALQRSPVGSIVEKINVTAGNEREGYQWHLPSCTHLVQAVGFVRDPLPSLDRDGETLTDSVGSGPSSGGGEEEGNGIGLEYDHQTGGFRDGRGRKVKSLYGAGIAFPGDGEGSLWGCGAGGRVLEVYEILEERGAGVGDLR